MTNQNESTTEEVEAFRTIHKLVDQFNWLHVVFTAADIRELVIHQCEIDDLDEPSQTEMEGIVRHVMESYEWQEGIKLHMIDATFDLLANVVWEQLGPGAEVIPFPTKQDS